MNQIGTNKLILHLHELHSKSESQPFNLKFVICQGEQNTQTKLQSRKQITLSNNKAQIQQAFELNLSKDGKIMLIILKTKLKQTSFFGQINIDTHRYMQQGLETINLQAAISRRQVESDNARLSLTLNFPNKKQPLRQFQIQRVLNKQLHQKEIKSSIITSTQSVASKSESESTIRNEKTRRNSTDFYKKNYKNLEILREDKGKNKQDSKSKDRSGSYKKRFQYQEGMKAKGKNTIVFLKQKKEKKDKQPIPVAREKTPQPMKLDKLSSSSQSKSRSKPISVRPRQATERSAEKPDKMFISIHAKTQRYETQSQALNERQHTFSKDSSINSIMQQNKYSNLVDKLRLIQTKIQDKRSVEKSYQKYIGHSRSKSKSNPQSQFQSQANSQSPPQSNEKPNVEQKSPLLINNQNIEDSVNRSVPASAHKDSKVEQFKQQSSIKRQDNQRHEDNRQSICTFGDIVKISNQSEILTVNKMKIIQLESQVLNLQNTVKGLEKQKQQNQTLIDKLSARYQKLVEQLQNIRVPYEHQINTLKQQLIKVKRSKKTPLETDLRNEKRKSLNLQNSLLLKQNELKHCKLNIKSMQDQRKQLQMHLAKKQCKMGQNSSRALLQAQIIASGYPSAIKAQNELLRSQNQLLQKHIDELNELVQQYQLQNSRAISNIKLQEVQDLKSMNALLNKNVEVQEQKSKKLETQLRRTKMNFAEMMNVVFEKGGDDLVEVIERRIIARESSGYISSSDIQ